jgi:predicted HAD superfamily Cof-like phosphohydrolase
MDRFQKSVRDFHKAIEVPVSPNEPAIRHGELRASLIMEEAFETACALVGTSRAQSIAHQQIVAVLQKKAQDGDDGKPDLAEAIDGVCDVVVVALGTAEEIGVDIEPFFNEVMKANLAKAGGPVREDGKRLRPEGWTPPDIEDVLAQAIARWKLYGAVEPPDPMLEATTASVSIYEQVKRSIKWLFDCWAPRENAIYGRPNNYISMSREQRLAYAVEHMPYASREMIECAYDEYMTEKRETVVK